jgi:4-amino-4-deoxy-L-arabinose transferase-like glycosyltransferase
VLLPMLSKRDFVTSHEARVGQTARQMAASGWFWNASPVEVPVSGLLATASGKKLMPLPGKGMMYVNPWLVPVLNGAIRLQKPPLPYWCTAIGYKLVGIGEAPARLPPAILGVIGTLLIYDLARRLLGIRAAVPAALVWASSHFICDEFRKSMADPYLTFFTLSAIWAWVAASRSRRSRRFILLFYISIALGALSKGPVILATVPPALISYHVLMRRTIPRRGHLIGVILFAMIALPWPIYVLRHVPNALELWRYESLGEFGENAEKARPWWLYLPLSLETALPWTPLWLAGLVLPLFRRRKLSPRNRKRLMLIAWFAMGLLIFSLANVKKKAYLLPLAGAQTLLTAEVIAVMLAWARRTRFADIPGVLETTQAAIGIGVAGTLFVMMFRVRVDRPQGIALASIAVIVALSALLTIPKRRPNRWLILQPAAFAIALFALLSFIQPDTDNRRSAKPLARQVAQIINQSHLPLVRSKLPEEASFYLPLNLPRDDESSRVLVILDDSRLEIDRGKLTPDEKYFSDLLDGTNVIAARRIDVSGSPARWKLYALTIDRDHA